MDHPRLCGEYLFSLFSPPVLVGSPPPMRGISERISDDPEGIRITPAYAGNISVLTPLKLINQDHPRLCGEYLMVGISDGLSYGSPPPMRGICSRHLKISQIKRITPAYAGNMHLIKSSSPQARDHPRLCGEYSTIALDITNIAGSPPPMRGISAGKATSLGFGRITPAYAGNMGLYHRL